jgi:hypothetical protein
MEAMRAKGAFVWKNHGSSHMMAGLPDIVGVYKGYFVGVETKMPEVGYAGLSPRQDYVHQRIRAAEGKVIVATCIEEALALLASIDSLIGEIPDNDE